MKLRPAITWLQYAFANVVIVVLLPLLTLQGMPPIDWAWSWAQKSPPEEPDPVADTIETWTGPLLDVTGTWTGPWWMFAPTPDFTNHRIQAEIEYLDGARYVWRSPEWPKLSCWRRFQLSRDLELMDHLGGMLDKSPNKLALWSAFADHLSRQQRTNPAPEGAPKNVRFILEVAYIGDPNEEGWQPMSQLYPRDEKQVVMIRKYPLPPELRVKQTSSNQRGAP